MKRWLGWLIIGVLLVGSIGLGMLVGKAYKVRTVAPLQSTEASQEEKEKRSIQYAVLTSGPIPTAKIKLDTKNAGGQWVVHIGAETEDGKLGTLLSNAKQLFRALGATHVPIKEVSAAFTTNALRDLYGRRMENLNIARIKITGPTWAKIDWIGFDPRNFAQVADEYWLHPLLQKQPLPAPRPDNVDALGQQAK